MRTDSSAVTLKNVTLRLGDRTLWNNLTAAIERGEFIAVLGPNGTGKTTFLKLLLGLVQPASGTVRINNEPPGRDNRRIGYIPQQKSFDQSLPLRGRDLVDLGLHGTRFGIGGHDTEATRLINEAITAVGAEAYAAMPIGLLSGGEQQRLRIAQALVSKPDLLLCDEPLLSLDVSSQTAVTTLLHTYRSQTKATIIFVTHEINPILPWVDRVLYIANGQWIIDTPEQVLKTETLSRLYGSHVEVLKVGERLLVVGAEEAVQATHTTHHGEHA